MALAGTIVIYGFLANALPVWLLLAPRGYLSTLSNSRVLMARRRHLAGPPPLQMARYAFCRCTGPIFAGRDLPVLLHHHRLRRRSGSTPSSPRHHAQADRARRPRFPIGSADVLEGSWHDGPDRGLRARSRRLLRRQLSPPHRRRNALAASAVITAGLPRDGGPDGRARAQVGERTCSRARGGAPSLRRHGPHLRARASGHMVSGLLVSLRDHVEALFILTILDAGTRVRPLHDSGSAGPRLPPVLAVTGCRHPPLERAHRYGWGFSLSGRARSAGRHQLAVALFGIRQPVTRDHRLVPLHHRARQNDRRNTCGSRRARCLLVSATFTACWQKIFSGLPRVAFWRGARAAVGSRHRPDRVGQAAETRELIINARLDAAVCGVFLIMVSLC